MIALPPWNRSLGLNFLLRTHQYHSAILLSNKEDLACFNHTCWGQEVESLTENGGNGRELKLMLQVWKWLWFSCSEVDKQAWNLGSLQQLPQESWNSAGKTTIQRAQELWVPCTNVRMPLCLGWCNTSSRPQSLYTAIVTSTQFISL